MGKNKNIERQWVIDLLEEELVKYTGEHCVSSDADGDWVEFEESNGYCVLLHDIIDFIKERKE